jgi:hypothetical protein
MKSAVLIVLIFALTLVSGNISVHAWGLPAVSSLGSGEGGDAAGFVKDTRNSLYSFAKSELGLARAIGCYTDLAAQQKLLDGMKAGDAAAGKEQMETLVTIDKSCSEAIKKQIATNKKLDSEHKALATQASVEYVKALVITTKLVYKGQSLAKNPVALAMNASSVLYAAKNLPTIVTSGTSNTSTLFKYLSANGVDISEAKAAAEGLGK